MSATILSDRWVVYYEADNRQKRLERDTSVTPTVTDTVNGLYSALQDHFDELTQLDDGSPMSAQTPTEYTIGIIDTGDDDPWFIDNTSVEYLTGGAIQTASWARVTSSNTGIVKFDYTVGGGTDLAQADKGKTITSSATSDSGTLLHFTTDGSNGTAWVRPADDTATHDWDGTPTDVAVTGGTGASLTQDAAAVTGEDLWSNINTIGTIADNTHIYIKQDGALLTASEAATDWWGDGQIDIIIKVREAGTEIDEAVVTIFARQQSKTYSYFTTDLSSGGRTAIPLSTGTDLDNQYGYRQMVVSTASGDFTVGEVIEDDSDDTIQGVVTSNTGTAPNLTIQYYLIGDPQNDFTGATGGFTGSISTETATAVAPTNVNAAASPATDITITFGSNETYDVDENDTTENYSIVIDLSDETLDTMQQRLKYLTRRGETADLDAGAQTITGEFYLGTEYVLEYSGTVTGGTIDEGDVIDQASTGAIGTVTSHNTTDKIIVLRDTRGSFNTTNAVTATGGGGGSATPDVRATVITPNAASPFGTYAGGTFFAAPGVVLANVNSTDATNYQLTDDDGNIVNPPNKVSVTVANTRDEDRIAVFRTSGGIIQKDEYAATAQTIGATTCVVGTAIAVDVPGKTAGGTLIVVGADEDEEYPVRFSSWTASTFTLASVASTTMDGGSTTTNITDTGAFASGVQIGDMVYNSTRTDHAWVTAVVDNDNITVAPPITGQTTGDSYEINTLPITTTTADDVYVPLLWAYEDTGTDGASGSESSTVTFDSTIPVLVVVRNSNSTASATTPMLPYSATASVTDTGLTNNVIRTQDTIKQ